MALATMRTAGQRVGPASGKEAMREGALASPFLVEIVGVGNLPVRVNTSIAAGYTPAAVPGRGLDPL